MILLVAAGAETIDINSIFAVFLLGIIIGEYQNNTDAPQPIKQANAIIQSFSLNFFAPIYFVSVGLKVNLTSEFDSLLTFSVIIVACLGKILGAAIGARLGGMTWREAWPVGIGLNARGAVGLVIASVALVLMALVTTFFTGFVLKQLIRSP